MRHMKLACAAVVLVTVSSDAMAQSRPLTTAMSCNQAQSLVANQGENGGAKFDHGSGGIDPLRAA